jgi:hypothetical protein
MSASNGAAVPRRLVGWLQEGRVPNATRCAYGVNGNLWRLLVMASRYGSPLDIWRTKVARKPHKFLDERLSNCDRKRSGEEAGIPATPGSRTLAASHPATKLSSCQRGPTLELDPVRCRFAANSASHEASALPHEAQTTGRELDLFLAFAGRTPESRGQAITFQCCGATILTIRRFATVRKALNSIKEMRVEDTHRTDTVTRAA